MTESKGIVEQFATMGITVHCCGDIEERWYAELAAMNMAEWIAGELATNTADRLGLRLPDDTDDGFGCETRVCERCLEDWDHGLEMSGGEAVCQPCLDAEAPARDA